jgi:hypothetical protein
MLKEKYKITAEDDLLVDHFQENDHEIYVTLFFKMTLFVF